MKFDDDWWGKLIIAWNASPYSNELAGLGLVQFDIIDKVTKTVCVAWDQRGHGCIIESNSKCQIKLSATTDKWASFIEGRFTAVEALVHDIFRFVGPYDRLFPFSDGFNSLAKIARDL